MALIKCSECGKEISDTTVQCIHCGHRVEKIINKKPQKKKFVLILKILLFFVGIILIWLAIAVIFPRKYVDFTVKYKDYLDYALGPNWVVTDVYKWKFFENGWVSQDASWTISYNVNNQKEEIRLHNRYGSLSADDDYSADYIFACQINGEYIEKLNNKLRKGKISKIDNFIDINDTYSYYSTTNGFTMFSKEILKLIDSKKGLNFRELSLENYNRDYCYLTLNASYTSGTNIEEYTINEAKKIINHYNIKNAEISAKYSLSDKCNKIYCIINGLEVSCNREMEEMMIDKDKYVNLKEGE